MARPKKVPSHTVEDIRCKGTKTDQDLLDEYFEPEPERLFFSLEYVMQIHDWERRRSLIVKELGMDKIRDEQIKRLESRVRVLDLKSQTNEIEHKTMEYKIARRRWWHL